MLLLPSVMQLTVSLPFKSPTLSLVDLDISNLTVWECGNKYSDTGCIRLYTTFLIKRSDVMTNYNDHGNRRD